MSFTHFLASRLGLSTRPASRRKTPAARPRFRPMLEALEDRWVPSTLTVTSTADSGSGSLRAEISAAKSGDTIVFNIPKSDPGYNSSTGAWIITLGNELDIKTSLTITGSGASQLAVSGNNATRVFEAAKGTQVCISGLTISNGLAVNGAGILADAGSTLTLNNCTLSGNNATVQQNSKLAGHQFGGGIDNFGTLMVSGCNVSGNADLYGAGGIENESGGKLTVNNSNVSQNAAGGIENDSSATATISGSTISHNYPGSHSDGGGITNDGGTLTVSGCTVSYNSGGDGGGIANDGGTLTVSGCTLTHNTATDCGGGICNQFGGTMTINGASILSYNSATNYGGGVYIDTNSGYTTTISDSSLLSNSAFEGGGIWGNATKVTVSGDAIQDNTATYEGGGIYVFAGTMTISGSSVTGNSAEYGGGIYLDTYATVTVENSSSITGNLAPSGYIADDVYNLGTLFLDSTSMIGILYGNLAQPI